MSHLLGDFCTSWTLPGGVSASDDDDQRRLESFFKTNPDFREASLAAVRRAATAPATVQMAALHSSPYVVDSKIPYGAMVPSALAPESTNSENG